MANHPLKLLLIDDDVDVHRMFKFVTNFHGGTLVAVKDAESALNCLEAHQPDIIIIDLYLDHEDGVKTLQLIRRSPFNPPCPIVATTAYFTPMTFSWSFLHGFDGYLEKPLKIENLWTYLETLALGARAR